MKDDIHGYRLELSDTWERDRHGDFEAAAKSIERMFKEHPCLLKVAKKVVKEKVQLTI